MAFDRRFTATLNFVSLAPLGQCRTVCATATEECFDRCHKRLHTNDVYYSREIVGEDVQSHLGSNLWQAVHQKVRSAHPHLERTERMLDGLAAHTHGLRVRIETLLHGFEHVFVLPSADAPLRQAVSSPRTLGYFSMFRLGEPAA
jgi:hypothetical protein